MEPYCRSWRLGRTEQGVRDGTEQDGALLTWLVPGQGSQYRVIGNALSMAWRWSQRVEQNGSQLKDLSNWIVE